MLWFRYRLCELWKLDARTYVEKRAIPIYGLLPAMSEVTVDLLSQAFDDMVEYYAEKKELLRDELLCFLVLLQRARRLPATELAVVLRRVRMFDPLLEEDPWVQEFGARKEAEGEARGEVRGELRSSRDIFVNIVKTRFPALKTSAEVRALQIDQPEVLTLLLQRIVLAPDEQTARALLEGHSTPLSN